MDMHLTQENYRKSFWLENDIYLYTGIKKLNSIKYVTGDKTNKQTNKQQAPLVPSVDIELESE